VEIWARNGRQNFAESDDFHGTFGDRSIITRLNELIYLSGDSYVIYSWIWSTKQRLPDSLLKLCWYVNIYFLTLREQKVFSLQNQVDKSRVMK
jgi:hypothetical protein